MFLLLMFLFASTGNSQVLCRFFPELQDGCKPKPDPTKYPSSSPSTASPSTPTSKPSVSPSTPTSKPSVSPSTPTSNPSVSPSSPTQVPSLSPTLVPSTDCTNESGKGIYSSFGIYLSVFMGIVIICMLLEKSGRFKKYTTRLADCFAEAIDDSNSRVYDVYDISLRFSGEFYAAVDDDERLYFPINGKDFSEKCLFPNGFKFLCFRLPIGLVENFLFYLCNNDNILAMFLTLPGALLSAGARRLLFICDQFFTFMLAGLFTAFFKNDPKTLNILTYAVVVPLSMNTLGWVKYILTTGSCGFINKPTDLNEATNRSSTVVPTDQATLQFRQRQYQEDQKTIREQRCCGLVLAYPLAFGFIWLGLVPAMYTAKACENPLNYIAAYAYEVFVVGMAYRAGYYMLIFNPYVIFGISLFGKKYNFFGVGVWLQQKRYGMEKIDMKGCCCRVICG